SPHRSNRTSSGCPRLGMSREPARGRPSPCGLAASKTDHVALRPRSLTSRRSPLATERRSAAPTATLWVGKRNGAEAAPADPQAPNCGRPGTQSIDLRSASGSEGLSTSMSPHSLDAQRDADHWRRLEAEARIVALTMNHPDRKRLMQFIAEGYKLLA